jgi:hypothetical protein
MELMDMSLDKFLERMLKLGKSFPEPILGKIAFSVCWQCSTVEL